MCLMSSKSAATGYGVTSLLDRIGAESIVVLSWDFPRLKKICSASKCALACFNSMPCAEYLTRQGYFKDN